MEFKKKQNNSVGTFFLCLILFFMSCSLFFNDGMIKKVSAETTMDNQKTLQNIVDNSVFITFSKGKESKYGRYIFACYYVPNELYDSSFEYGVVVFPKWFSEEYGITGNYIEEYTAVGMGDSLAILSNSSPLSASDGKIIRCRIVDIPKNGVDIELSFIFFVRDSGGNIVYDTPRHAIYADPLIGDYTSGELLAMVDERIVTEKSFRTIIVKIQELVNSVWVYVVIALSSVVVVWGAYIGIKVVIAKKNEEKVDARGMVKSLIIGIVIMFVIAMGAPLLINGLSSWFSW